MDDFRPDHILIALRNSEDEGWQERGLLDNASERIRLLFEIGAESQVPGSNA